MGSVRYVQNICVKKCVESNFWQIAQILKIVWCVESRSVKNLWHVQFAKTWFLTTCNYHSTEVNGRAKVFFFGLRAEQALSDPRPRGRRRFPHVMTFWTNFLQIVIFQKYTLLSTNCDSTNRESTYCYPPLIFS